MNILTPLTCAVGVTFLIYGGLCLSSLSMVEDFQRFGLERLRMLTGLLEVLGGSGLLVGLKWRPALSISSAGLSLLMLVAFGVRLKMRDSIVQSLPSLALMLVNAYILVKSLQR
jgi:DoxX-like family